MISMQYRKCGRCGFFVSAIGLGCEGFSGKSDEYIRDLINRARKAGINFIDLFTPDPAVRDSVGRALEKDRADFIIQGHLCTYFEDGQYTKTRSIERTKEAFSDLLARLKTDYIDIGMIHYVDTMEEYNEVFNGKIGEFAAELKRTGKIRHIGMSSHNAAVALRAVREMKIDVLMFSINPAYDLENAATDIYAQMDFADFDRDFVKADSERAELYAACEAAGVAISVMKAFGGGRLLDAATSPFGSALTPVQCISYALSRPGVCSVMCGCATPEELEADCAYCTATDAERSFSSVFADFSKLKANGVCMYCGHCAPCTSHIDIAAVSKLLDLAFMYDEVPKSVENHYDGLEYHAIDCVECAQCEARCPFGVQIRDMMKRAQRVFGR
ncbi:MAG TPA: aldo/keto reductase [Methanocorpusculum sp.]|nr:aldo/keto reductase [Methanocorpusculum sp.]